MKLGQREVEGNVIIDIEGEIDLYNAPEVKETIKKLIDDKKLKIIVNLSKVSYIDSSGIGALISAVTALKKEQGYLKLVNVYASVKKVFELTKLTSFFDIYDSEEAAIKA
ncbi:MAG: STAS domain-containing protein [Spirochaetia bacterium]|nr:STAS domain-containing protein [Spirochaetia bacterium]